MTLWFSSDQHFRHINCLKIMPFRPWKTIEEMELGLINNWNSVVSDNDTVIILGDFIMGKHKYKSFPEIIPKLKGFKLMVLGNHDRGFNDGDLAIYEEFGFQIYTENIMLNKIVQNAPDNILLSHFPFLGSHSEEFDNKYEACCPIDDGKSILFHGHTHQQVPMVRSRMISVGVDAWGYKPVSFETLMAQVEAHDRYPNKNL